MNKKDLSAFRRQFKTDSYALELKQLYTVYVKKDNQNIVYAELDAFNMKSESEQEIFLASFKKLLTGALDSKIFELSFEGSTPEADGQALCRTLLEAQPQAFAASCDAYIAKMSAHYTYETDVVISFVNGKYNKPTGKKSRKGAEDSLDGFDDTTFGFNFIMCSVSNAVDAKRGIYYSASTERFELNSSLDKLVNFTSPIDGFVFPSFGGGYSDINKLIYYTSKANHRNETLLTEVLHCKYEPTAKEEQEKFEEILRLVNGEKIRPDIVKSIYESINEKVEAYADTDEAVMLNAAELRDIFEECGVENLDGFDDAFIHAAEYGFEFKAASLAAGVAGSVKISSGVANISVSLADLGAVKQVINAKGRKCLQIELGDDAQIGVMTLATETD